MKFWCRNNNQNCEQQANPKRTWLSQRNKVGAGRIFALVALFAVAGCSSLMYRSQAILSDSESNPAITSAALHAQAKIPATLQQRRHPLTIFLPPVRLSRTARPHKAKSGKIGYENSEFVRDDPSLFSNKIDLKPFPTPGTVAWKRQKRIDELRDKRLKREMTICSDC